MSLFSSHVKRCSLEMLSHIFVLVRTACARAPSSARCRRGGSPQRARHCGLGESLRAHVTATRQAVKTTTWQWPCSVRLSLLLSQSIIVLSVLFAMKNYTTHGPIMRLPPEVLKSIFSRVPRSSLWLHDLFQLLTVCKYWTVGIF
jgi:hypothetical protein